MKQLFVSLILVASVLDLSGCSKPSTTPPSTNTESVILISSESATLVGLTALSVANPTLAQTVAASLKGICDGGALPYLNGTGGAAQAISSATINTFLSQQFSSMPQEAQTFVTIAASALDEYLPAPSATTYLSTSEIAYIKDFFTGISNGCSGFIGGKTAVAPKNSHPRTVGGAWFNLTAQAAAAAKKKP